MAQLPADRTKLALAQSNQVPGTVASSTRNINAITELYDTTDKLYNFTTELISAGTLSRLGVINVRDYNASGSAQTTTGSITQGTNRVALASIIDFSVGQGIWLEGIHEVASLTVTNGAASSANCTVTLNGTGKTVALASGDSADDVATKIRAATYPGWTTGGSGATVTFTSDTSGVKTDATYSAGTTGATGTMTTTTQGTANIVSAISAINNNVVTIGTNAPVNMANVNVRHDDTQAIQTAINYAISLGKSEIVFPYGTYIYGTLTDADEVTAIGDGVILIGDTPLNLTSLAALSADIATTARTLGAKGDGVTDDTAALQLAAASGKAVTIYPGTYVIKGSIDFAPNTRFTCIGKPIFKVMSDVNAFLLAQEVHITGGCAVDVSGVIPYTKRMFEISSATLQGKTDLTFIKLGLKLYDIDVIAANDGNTVQGSFFHAWASAETDDGTTYTCHGMWDIDIRNINIVQGYIGYGVHNWCYRKNDLVADGWITGVRLENFMVYGAQYGIFGSKSESTMSNALYYDATTMYVNNFIYEYTTKTKMLAFLTDRGKTFKDCFAWDFPGGVIPYKLLYRSSITNSKIFFDGESFDIEQRIDVLDYPATKTTREKFDYIRRNLSGYAVKTNNILTEYRAKSFGLGAGLTYPYYIKLAEFTDTEQKDTAFLMNLGYNLSYDTGTVIVTLRKADSAPTNPATNPTLSVHTSPYIAPSRFAEFYISKSVSGSIPTYKIYMKLSSNTLGAGCYYVSLHGDSVYNFKIQLETVSDPTGTETLIAASDIGIVNFPQRASNPGTAVGGFAYFNTASNTLDWYDGAAWHKTKAGTATILTSGTSVVVAHGMGVTPTSVIATGKGNIGNVWASSIGSTNFTLNCSSAPGSDTVVSWSAST